MQFGRDQIIWLKLHVATFEVIIASLVKGGVVGAAFLDLRKAFDMVNHSVLLSKLSKFQLSVNIINWTQSYLLDHLDLCLDKG